jgi:hypothetical protein
MSEGDAGALFGFVVGVLVTVVIGLNAVARRSIEARNRERYAMYQEYRSWAQCRGIEPPPPPSYYQVR